MAETPQLSALGEQEDRTSEQCKAMMQLDDRFQAFMVRLVLDGFRLHGLGLSDVVEIVIRWQVNCAHPMLTNEALREHLIRVIDAFLKERGSDLPPPRGAA